MVTPSNENILALNAFKASRRHMRPESLSVINDARDLALKRITGVLAGTFDKIEDELFEMAEKSLDREAQNLYLDARAQSREKRAVIEVAFKKQFLSFFERKVNGEDTSIKNAAPVDFSALEMTLVDDSELEEDLALSSISKRMGDKCDEELRGLSQRMGFLLSEPELGNDANPMSPDTVVNALKAACDQMTFGYQAKLMVMKLIEQHIAKEMLGVYKDVNAQLIGRQILPTLRANYGRPQAAGQRSATPKSPTGVADPAGATTSEMAAFTATGGTVGAADAGFDGSGDIFATLQKLLGGGASGAGSAVGVATAGPTGAAGAAGAAGNPMDATAALAQLFGGGGGAGAATGSANADAMLGFAGGIAGASGPMNFGPAATQNLLSALSSLQIGGMGLGNAGGMQGLSGLAGLGTAGGVSATGAALDDAGMFSPEVAAQNAAISAAVLANLQAARNFLPGQMPVAELGILRELKAQGLAQSSSQVDSMTIDIVAMLFDYVFEDKSVPDTIKALIARLQIPMLKVAILDKTFFSQKSHPARHLLDVLAEASVCYADEASKEDPLYKKTESLVERIQSQFETDLNVFADAITEFQTFLAERETASEAFIQKSAQVLHENERREMARMVAQDETERRANTPDLPIPVGTMLRGPWTRTLERIYLREAGRGEAFIHSLGTADDLVWSVLPKNDGEARKRLVALLPSLLRRLKEGFDIASIEEEDRSRFFSVLIDCHAAAVKAGLRGESVMSLYAAVNATAEAKPLFEKLVAEEKAREIAFKKVDRSGFARISFGDDGVEIEEVSAAKPSEVARFAKPIGADEAPIPAVPKGPRALRLSAMPTAAALAQAADLAATQVGNTPKASTPKVMAGGIATVDFDLSEGADDDDVFNDDDDDIEEYQLEKLTRGTWVEFMQAGGERIRAKLTWISPLKGIYLFTNPGEIEALSIEPLALAKQVRRGQARIIEKTSLIDRAVSSMVRTLSAKTK